MSTKIPRKRSKRAPRPDARADCGVTFADPLLTEKETAARLGLSPGTLTVWRCTKRYPLAFVRLGRLIRYRLSAIEDFLRARTANGDGTERR